MGGSYLYPRSKLGLSLLNKGFVFGLDLVPYKEEGNKVVEGSAPLPSVKREKREFLIFLFL